MISELDLIRVRLSSDEIKLRCAKRGPLRHMHVTLSATRLKFLNA
jgi:hypothetical protein